jgi:hypothetical protein
MGRPESPEGRRVPVSFKLSESEAALVDSVRGDTERGPWVRQAALDAARRIRDTGIPEPVRIPLVVSDRQPPGTVTAVSVGTGTDGEPVVHAAAINIGPAEQKPKRDPKTCRHENMRLHRGWCADCETIAVKK